VRIGFAFAVILIGCTACAGPSETPRPVDAVTSSAPTSSPGTPMPRIIQETLFKQNMFYGVRGSVFNPTDRAMKNVIIKYYLFKSHMGKPNEGLLVQATGGLVEARVRYLPPHLPVEFVAYSENAPTGGRTPEVEPEITAEWE
jgi:hypothetical protein